MRTIVLPMICVMSFSASANQNMFPSIAEIRALNKSFGQFSGARNDEISTIRSIVAAGDEASKTIDIIYSIDVELTLSKADQATLIRELQQHQLTARQSACKNVIDVLKPYRAVKNVSLVNNYFDTTGLKMGQTTIRCK